MSVTYQADRPPGRARASDRSWTLDRDRTFTTARRHSRRVRALRIILPACAVFATSLYLLSMQMRASIGDHQFSVGQIELTRDTLRMVNAKLEGANGGDGTYLVTADYAEQDLANPTDVHLTGIRARMLETDESWSRLAAPKGTFDTQKELLTLFGGIDVESSAGMTGRLVAATVDMKGQRVHSQQPVTINFLNGRVDARSMEIAMDERVILFTGEVRVAVRKRAPDAVPDAATDRTAVAR